MVFFVMQKFFYFDEAKSISLLFLLVLLLLLLVSYLKNHCLIQGHKDFHLCFL